jgi:hypothetical protein
MSTVLSPFELNIPASMILMIGIGVIAVRKKSGTAHGYFLGGEIIGGEYELVGEPMTEVSARNPRSVIPAKQLSGHLSPLLIIHAGGYNTGPSWVFVYRKPA